MVSFKCVHIHCYLHDVCPKVRSAARRLGVRGNGGRGARENDGSMVHEGAMSKGPMSEGRYLWEPAVLNAFTATPETVAAKIEIAKQAIADRLQEQDPPYASE